MVVPVGNPWAWRRSGRVVVALLLMAPAFAQDPDRPPPPQDLEETVPREASALEQLAEAKRRKQEVRGKRGALRIRHLQKAAEAYRAVARYWPDEPALVTEAHFRRAEILRTLDEPGAARGAFESALETAPQGDDHGVRALVEIGHLCRRAGQHRDAMRYYRRARDREEVSLRFQNDGREWLAKTYLELFDWEGAEYAALDWEEHAEGTVDRIRAIDLKLLAWIGMGRLFEVGRELEALEERLVKLATAPTREGEAVARALEGMKAKKAMWKARRNGR